MVAFLVTKVKVLSWTNKRFFKLVMNQSPCLERQENELSNHNARSKQLENVIAGLEAELRRNAQEMKDIRLELYKCKA